MLVLSLNSSNDFQWLLFSLRLTAYNALCDYCTLVINLVFFPCFIHQACLVFLDMPGTLLPLGPLHSDFPAKIAFSLDIYIYTHISLYHMYIYI